MARRFATTHHACTVAPVRPSPLVALALVTMICGAGCDGGDSEAPTLAHVATIAGGSLGDGRLATEVPLDASDLATDRQGNIYLNDHARLHRIDRATGRISTIAGGDDPAQCRYTIGTRPACLDVSAIAIDRNDRIYATHTYENAIVEIEPATGAIRFVAQTSWTGALTTDPAGDLFVNDIDEARILRIDPRTGAMTRAAGNGDGESTAAECPLDVPATATCLGRSVGLAADREGGLLISGDLLPSLRRVDPDTGFLTALPAPNGRVAVAADDTLVVSLPDEDRVVRANPRTGAVTTLIAGTPDDPLSPRAVAVDPEGRTLVLTGDHRLLRLDRAGGDPEVVAGNGSADHCGDGGPATDACLGQMNDLDVAPNGDVVLAEASGPIRVIGARDGRIATLTDLRNSTVPACNNLPSRLAVGPTGDAFVAGFFFAACRVDHETGAVSLVAGGTACDGLGNPAPRAGDLAVGACLFFTDLLVEKDGAVLIADDYKPHIWRIDPATGRLAVVAGTGEGGPCDATGDGGDARAACVSPFRLGQDGAGNLYVLESGDFGEGTRVRRIDAATGVITTVAGTGVPDDCGDGGPAVAACLAARNLLVDASGNLFLGGRNGVRKVDAATGLITTVYRDDTSRFDISLDALDDRGRLLFFTAESAPRVRRLTLPATPR